MAGFLTAGIAGVAEEVQEAEEEVVTVPPPVVMVVVMVVVDSLMVTMRVTLGEVVGVEEAAAVVEAAGLVGAQEALAVGVIG